MNQPGCGGAPQSVKPRNSGSTTCPAVLPAMPSVSLKAWSRSTMVLVKELLVPVKYDLASNPCAARAAGAAEAEDLAAAVRRAGLDALPVGGAAETRHRAARPVGEAGAALEVVGVEHRPRPRGGRNLGREGGDAAGAGHRSHR